jgi:hypothetical protein
VPGHFNAVLVRGIENTASDLDGPADDSGGRLGGAHQTAKSFGAVPGIRGLAQVRDARLERNPGLGDSLLEAVEPCCRGGDVHCAADVRDAAVTEVEQMFRCRVDDRLVVDPELVRTQCGHLAEELDVWNCLQEPADLRQRFGSRNDHHSGGLRRDEVSDLVQLGLSVVSGLAQHDLVVTAPRRFGKGMRHGRVERVTHVRHHKADDGASDSAASV